MASVADLQRKYRFLVEKIRETGEPMVVVKNGKPDVVVMDIDTYEAQSARLKELEENYLLSVAKEGLDEYKRGETTKLKKDQKLLNLI